MHRGVRLSETTPNGLCFALPWADTADIEQRGLVRRRRGSGTHGCENA